MDEITNRDSSSRTQECQRKLQRRNKRYTSGTEKNKSTTSPILSPDILFLILLELPEQLLQCLQCVSKEFQAMITDPIFIAHRRPSLIIRTFYRLATTPGCYKHFHIGFPKVEEIHLVMPKYIMRDPYFIGSCHGLLYFLGFSKAGRIACVYNSLTKSWIATPPIQAVGKFYILYRSSTGKYQLLTFFMRENESIHHYYIGRYMVHELGTASWRALPETGSYVPLRYRQTIHVAMFGCLYWICFSLTNEEKRMIMSFDVETEQFNYIREPPAELLPATKSKALTLIETKAGLGYPTFTPCTMDIWVMKGRNETWKKDYVINIEPIQGSLRTCPSMPSYVLLLGTIGEILFLDNRLDHNGSKPKLTIYDCKCRTFTSVDLWRLIPDCYLGVLEYSVCTWKNSKYLNSF